MKAKLITLPRLTAAIVISAPGPLVAATVTLNPGGDGFGTSSFNSGNAWSDATAPGPANDYHVPVVQLRTPPDGASHTFAGASLSIDPGGVLLYKGAGGAGILTIPNLILNGGVIDHASGFADICQLQGGIEVSAASTIHARQGPVVIASNLTGTAPLTLPATHNANAYPVTFSGNNLYSGDITADGNLILDPAGVLTFAIGAGGLGNRITGGGSATFNGTLDIDLTSAGTTAGDQWQLVDTVSLDVFYGSSFALVSGPDPWTEVAATALWSVWISPTGDYRFDESSGVLERVEPDSDQDGLPDSWEMAKFGHPTSPQHGSDDPDLDLCSNFLEYLADTDPNSAASFPDSDGDTLPDGWEYFWFLSLGQGPDDDYDDDWNSNATELAAGTSPASFFDYPDEDNSGVGDWLNDGWEIHYFGSIEACDPGVDDDGDLFTNEEEFWEGSDPTEQVSSPDTDSDGLPDGWEVKYFRVGSEDLETVIAKWGPNDDPDKDRLTNKLELLANTNPMDILSGERTLGYWRFEEATAGEVPAGGNGAYAFPTSIRDSSPYGNHMMAWADYSRPNHDPAVRAATVPATGAANSGSLFFQRNGNGIYYIEAVFSTPTAYLGGGEASLRTFVFDEFTIEASFNTTLASQWQVPLAKFGNPVGGQPPFSLKIDPTNLLRAGIVDGSGVAREIIGTTPVNTNSWYSAAVTGTATEMKLWLKGPGDAGYKLEGGVAIAGAWHEPAEGPLDTPWNIGQGIWNGTATDAFQGNVDEVRISAVALAPEAFLFHEESGFTGWAEANIPDEEQRGEGDDADGDGTTNLVEFLLGLDPANGSSFFATSLDGTTLTWPAADGIEFTVQSSTTLMPDSWADVDTVTATGPTATWTPAGPLADRVFYRVTFAE